MLHSPICAFFGSTGASFRNCCQFLKLCLWWFVSSALIVARYMSCPSADFPITSTVRRPLLWAAIASSVQPTAYQGMCG